MGRPFKAVYTVTNVGADDALRVKVKDEWPSTSFEVLAGKAAASWTKLEALSTCLAGLCRGLCDVGGVASLVSRAFSLCLLQRGQPDVFH
jgi:hypothetical protein